ncbi:hypothetical protein GGF46_001066 [Coemansia sp. RSA 552]|nr:hypothetical protein GGF46_001066 [Coemansia sp. RSA 552]
MPPKTRGRGRGRGRGGRPAATKEKTRSPDPDTSDLDAIAKRHWLGHTAKWSETIVTRILHEHIANEGEARGALQQLERSQYLELYLWPHYQAGSASTDVLLSILLLLNEKFQQGLHASVWELFSLSEGASFGQLFDDVVELMRSQIIPGSDAVDPMKSRVVVVQFLIACFGSLETSFVRDSCMPLVSLALWYHVGAQPLIEREFAAVPQLRKFWKHTSRRWSARPGKTSDDEAARNRRDRDFVAELLSDFIATLFSPHSDEEKALVYCLNVLELLTDVLLQLPTRRYVCLLVDDYQLVSLCAECPWAQNRRFSALAQRFKDSVYFQVDSVSGRALSEEQARDRHCQKLADLQLIAFTHFQRPLDALVVAGVTKLGCPEFLAEHLEKLTDEGLRQLAGLVGVRTESPVPGLSENLASGALFTREFLLHLLVERFRKRPTVADHVRGASLYPTEKLLFDETLAETDRLGQSRSAGYPVLPIPKLNLQFLALHDYLGRCFELSRLESAFEIREDVEDAVARLQPQRTYEEGDPEDDGSVYFAGWTRMALPLHSFEVRDVQRPLLGEQVPARVRAELAVDLSNHTESIRREWDAQVRPHDVLILVAAQPGASPVQYVRGCEIECRLDADGKPIGDEDTQEGGVRYFCVLLDRYQYATDQSEDEKAVYSSLNVALRRRPQENNFKGLLDTVRGLMTVPPGLPEWLESTFLGYGDPAAAVRVDRPKQMYFGDTFVSEDHVRASFPGRTVEIEGEFSKPCMVELGEDDAPVRVLGQPPVNMGPVEMRRPRENLIRFTPTQVAAIESAACKGLTLVVGPPGTGKTDTAVQIIANLYHTQETTLLITHSNQALNQLFEKIIGLDIEPRHLLRLGHGEEELDAEERYSKAGRIGSYLDRRQQLLDLVQQLAESLGIQGDFGYTCETARFLFVAHIKVRWEAYRRKVRSAEGQVAEAFPFTKFFEAHVGRALFTEDVDAADCAEGCFRYLESIFDELAEIQPFELLRSAHDRSAYLLANQARIVAMTCTHAALKRDELVRLGLRFDNIVMEEAAQALDIEAFIPLTLQRDSARLKRLVMIGDHNQLPPVVKNRGLASYAHLEQSLFARLVRLGVPYVELDRQARARPEIANLFRYRYRALGDLEDVVSAGAYARPNPGMLHTFQFINVPDYEGKGESEPSKFFFQNLGEAEYLVAVYQYLRLLGYAKERIAILTTYNGQRALLRDVLEHRCSKSYLGIPRVSTVDQFQGQQCDIVLLSLVRTKAIGHIRDPRRLTVALSRARLGIYVFGRRSLFEPCFELRRPMEELLKNGDKLAICPNERVDADVPKKRPHVLVGDVADMGRRVFGMVEEREAAQPAAMDESLELQAQESEGKELTIE